MREVLEMIDRAVLGFPRGRSTDVRQRADDSGNLHANAGLRPDGWLVTFPDQQYGEDGPIESGGPVAVALSGHEDLDDKDFRAFVDGLHDATYSRQTSDTSTLGVTSSGLDDGTLILDLRRCAQRGDFEAETRRVAPRLFIGATTLVALLDRLAPIPMFSGILADYRETNEHLRIGDVITYLDDLRGRVHEPRGSEATLGDTVTPFPNTNQWRLP